MCSLEVVLQVDATTLNVFRTGRQPGGDSGPFQDAGFHPWGWIPGPSDIQGRSLSHDQEDSVTGGSTLIPFPSASRASVSLFRETKTQKRAINDRAACSSHEGTQCLVGSQGVCSLAGSLSWGPDYVRHSVFLCVSGRVPSSPSYGPWHL